MSTTFYVALVLVVLALVGVIWSGAKGRRSLHYGLIVAKFAVLGWAIREAELMGRALDFSGRAAPVKQAHMVAIGVTFLLVPLLVISGVKLAKGHAVAQRRTHRKLALLYVVSVLVTCSLGGAMTWLAEPRAAAAPGESAASAPAEAPGEPSRDD